MERINLELFYFINNAAGHNRLWDQAAIFLSRYLPLFLILFIVWGLIKGKEPYRRILIGGCVSIGVGIGMNILISLFFFHPRPFALRVGKTLLYHAANTSFPSRHTTFMMSFSLFLCYFRYTYRRGLILLALSLLCGLLRVYCGVHFPWDIVGSFLVSLVASLGVFMFFYNSAERKKSGRNKVSEK